MSCWKIAFIVSGLLVLTLIARKCRVGEECPGDTEKRYNVDDLIMDQEI